MLVIKITTGFILDLIFGDPCNFPHPVRLIGKLISFLEKPLIKLNNKKAAGLLLMIIITALTFSIVYILSSIHFIIEIFFIYTLFCVKSLAAEARKIYNDLSYGDIDKARESLAFLVSRDTKKMSESAIIKATVETVSENLVDGIISPLFYLFTGGAPLAYAFKAVSTLDSMVGYKNERYIDFGWASARFDDLLNYIPARITAFILLPIAALLNGKSASNTARIAFRDRGKHSSPNSALPEAAMAGALGVSLGGPARYFGEIVDRPAIGDEIKTITKEDITDCVKLMFAASIVGLIIASITYWFIAIQHP